MTGTVSAITNPISLCAYVVSVVFALLAAKWKPKGDGPDTRRLFYLGVFVAFFALTGGLFLAWRQLPKPAPTAPSGPVTQQSNGDQSPNVVSTGNGAVTVQNGTQSAPPAAKLGGKAK
jgi:hypothetical protein